MLDLIQHQIAAGIQETSAAALCCPRQDGLRVHVQQKPQKSFKKVPPQKLARAARYTLAHVPSSKIMYTLSPQTLLRTRLGRRSVSKGVSSIQQEIKRKTSRMSRRSRALPSRLRWGKSMPSLSDTDAKRAGLSSFWHGRPLSGQSVRARKRTVAQIIVRRVINESFKERREGESDDLVWS